MTAPSGIDETIEVLDAGFATAIRLKNMLTAGSPGGKQATLDELLSTVTDGEMKDSIRNLVDAVEKIVKGSKVDLFELIPVVVQAILDFLTTLKAALEDKRIAPEEILHGVTDGDLRPELSKAIEGIDKIPAELKGMDMMKMFAIFQRITQYLPKLTETVA